MAKQFKTVYSIPSVSNQGYTLTVQPCQEGVLFERDQPIRFEVTLTRDGQPCSDGDLHAYFNWNSDKIVWHECLELKDGKAQIEFSCELSGCGNLHVLYYRDDEEILEHIRGLAISPERLKRSYPCPPDFDAFWEAKKRLLDEPVRATLTPVNHESHPHLHEDSHKTLLQTDISRVDISDVQVESPAGNVSGILTRPKDSAPGSLPAVLFLHGAGVRACVPERFVERAESGLMVFEVNAHGIPNDKPQAWYKEIQNTGFLKDYQMFGRESRDRHYFVNMYLRVKRALQYLMSRPEWDGKVLVTMGGSQGAAQAYAGAYLEDRVSALVGTIPAYGDLTGFLVSRKVNWSDWLHLKPRGRIDLKAIEVATYLDPVNLLRNYKRPACFCLGLLDQGCLPTTNLVPIMECPADATVILQSDCYHGGCPESNRMTWDFVFEHIEKVKGAPCCRVSAPEKVAVDPL